MSGLLRVVVGGAGAAALGFLATVLIARGLGADGFGLFASVVALWALLAPLLAMGSGKVYLRLHARGDGAARGLLLAGAVAGLGMAVLATGATALLGPALLEGSGWFFLFAGAALATLVLQDPVLAVLQARHAYTGVAAWQLLQPLARLSAALALIAASLPLLGFMAVYAVAELLVVLLALVVLWRWAGTPGVAGGADPAALPRLLREGRAFAVSGLLYTVYYQSDVLLLGLLDGTAAAGFYKAAFVFVAAAYLLPQVVFQRYLQARVFRWWEEPEGPARRLLRLLPAAVLFGAVAGLGAGLLAPLLINTAYGAEYAPSVVALQGLALAIPFHATAIACSAFLVTPGGIGRKVRVQVVVAVLNVGLNLVLIPLYGILGAVAATVFCELVLLAGYGWILWRELRARLPGPATGGP